MHRVRDSAMTRIKDVLDLTAGAIWDSKFPGVAVGQVGYIVCTGAHIPENMQKCCKINNRNGKITGRPKNKLVVQL